MKNPRRSITLSAIALLIALNGVFFSGSAQALGTGGIFTNTDMRQVCADSYGYPLSQIKTVSPNFSTPFSSLNSVMWMCNSSIPVFKQNGTDYCKARGYGRFDEITQQVTRWFFWKYTVRVGYKCT